MSDNYEFMKTNEVQDAKITRVIQISNITTTLMILIMVSILTTVLP